MKTLKVTRLSALAVLLGFALLTGENSHARQRRVGKVREIMIEDLNDHRKSRVEHILEEEDGQRRKRFKRIKFKKKLEKRLRTGSEVQIEVEREDSESVEVAASNGLKVLSAPPQVAASAPSGTRRVAVLMVNTNAGNIPCSKAAVEKKYFGPVSSTVDGGYNELTYGNVRFSGDVYAVKITNFSATSCATWPYWEQAARDNAAAQGINLAAYDHVYYEFPKAANGCPGGYADLNGRNAASFGYCETAGLPVHELGHNLGMMHANSSYLGGQFESKEYGDYSDPMGYFWGISTVAKLVHFNGAHKAFMGWVSATQAADKGIYDLTPIANSNPQLIKVPTQSSGEVYYASYRAPILLDVFLPAAYKGGTSIHLLSTPSGATSIVKVLADGQSYTDTSSGITFKQLSHDASSAKVQVFLNGTGGKPPVDPTPDPLACVKANPSLEITPNLQFGGQGKTVAYQLKVTNNDTNCPATKFLMTTFVQKNFSANTLAPLTVNSGASVTVPLNITTANVSMPIGVYGFTAFAKDELNASHGSHTSGVLAFDNVLPAPPVVTISTVTGKVNLAWNSYDGLGQIASWDVYRNGVKIANVKTPSFVDVQPSGSRPSYKVIAIDPALNASVASTAVSILVK